MTGLTIKGTGRYLPDRIVENEEFTSFLDTSDEWIQSHTGIARRRVAVDEPTWYMGAEAAKRAIESAGIKAEQLDMILCTTVTSNYLFPSVACLIQNAVGATNAFCFDLSAACAGCAYAMDAVWRYLATGCDTILLVSAETLTQVTNYEDRGTCVLTGDGAGACVITKGEGLFGSSLESDGAGAKYLYAKRTRSPVPFSRAGEPKNYDPFEPAVMDKMFMAGHDVYRFATKAMPRLIEQACEKAGIAIGDLDLIIPHQANIRIIQTAMKNLKLPMEKAYVNIQEYGNTSSATTMIALDECVRSGRVKRGDKVCMVGFGGGLVAGAVVFEF